MINEKKLCLNCLQSFKGRGTCSCSDKKIIGVSYRVRGIKKNSSNKKRKDFILYISGYPYIVEKAKELNSKIFESIS